MFNPSKYTSFFKPKRYTQKYIKNDVILKNIKDQGYAVTPFLSDEDVETLFSGYMELKQLLKHDIGRKFWPSGRHPDPKIRNFAKTKIEGVVPQKLTQLFVEDSYRLIGGTYLAKPPSPESALNPHQDSSHVNEFTHYSTYIWVPLQDVDIHSGCVRVLPKSHQLNIKQRSLNVPWVLQNHTEVLDDYMIDVPMKAGEALIFDSALIHASPPNYGESDRVAVNYYVHPNGTPFCHYYTDEHTPKGEVEVFEVTPDFYYTEDFESKPSKKYRQLENQKQLIPSISQSDLITVLDELSGTKELGFIQSLFSKIGL